MTHDTMRSKLHVHTCAPFLTAPSCISAVAVRQVYTPHCALRGTLSLRCPHPQGSTSPSFLYVRVSILLRVHVFVSECACVCMRMCVHVMWMRAQMCMTLRHSSTSVECLCWRISVLALQSAVAATALGSQWVRQVSCASTACVRVRPGPQDSFARTTRAYRKTPGLCMPRKTATLVVFACQETLYSCMYSYMYTYPQRLTTE